MNRFLPGAIAPVSRPFWTVTQLAELWLVSERTIRRWLKNGELTGHRFGNSWRISEADRLVYERVRRLG